jgi:hypothetical protein
MALIGASEYVSILGARQSRATAQEAPPPMRGSVSASYVTPNWYLDIELSAFDS